MAGRHTAPQHGVSQLHECVASMWQWLFTGIDFEHTFLGQSVRNQYLSEKVCISTESTVIAVVLTSQYW